MSTSPKNKGPQKKAMPSFSFRPFRTWLFGLNLTFNVFHKFLLFLVSFFLLLGALGIGVGTGYFAYLVSETQPPTKEELQRKISDFDEVSKLTYSDQSVISTISTDLVRTSIPGDQISSFLKKAIVSTEDEYFQKHKGIVPKALIRAVISDITGLGGTSGGSTLTQQLVKQQILTSETTFKRKANEILLAMRVDKFFTKDEIITAYLNISPFGRNNKGENIAGVEEAATGIFGKHANDLTIAQAAFIAGLPQSPIVYSPYLGDGTLKDPDNLAIGLKRKDNVLFAMYREGAIKKEEYEAALKEDLTKEFIGKQQREEVRHGFLYYTVFKQTVEALIEKNLEKDKLSRDKVFNDTDLYNQYYAQAKQELQKEGYTVQTTINPQIHNALNQAVSEYAGILDDGQGTYVENGGILMDNKNGQIYGFVAGRDFNKSQNNHAFDTKRAPGSTIKPVLAYGPAVDIGFIGTKTKLSNFKTTYKSDKKIEIWNAGTPPDNTFHTALDSLTQSLNIPTYHLYQGLIKKIDPADYMKKMEYDNDAEDFHHESSPLGQMDMTVYDQTKGFATLANGGEYNRGYMIEKITDSQGNIVYQHKPAPVRVYSKAAASVMNDMMKNVFENGTGNTASDTLKSLNWQLGNADWAAKTGTTSDYKDFWFIASTPGITYSSWVGYDDGTVMLEDNNYNNQRFWAYLMNRVYQVNPDIFKINEKFTLTKEVKKVNVSNYTGDKFADFEHKGKKYKTPGTAVTSLFAKGTGKNTTYEFGVGGTAENYEKAWQGRLSQAYGNTRYPSAEVKDTDKDDDE